jgi:hypothetical protein
MRMRDLTTMMALSMMTFIMTGSRILRSKSRNTITSLSMMRFIITKMRSKSSIVESGMDSSLGSGGRTQEVRSGNSD